MSYKSIKDCILDLKQNNELNVISKEVDPEIEMASIHLKEFQGQGKAIFFKNIKNTKYPAVSNLFGSLKRSKFLFRKSLSIVKDLIRIKTNPISILKNPISSLYAASHALYALPKKVRFSKNFEEISINDLPKIKSWKEDGGAFITLPQVYSEDINNPGILNSNLGMYRIQLTGNKYILNKEIGMHYQIHRGIGVHQKNANDKNLPLKVSVFVGGPPAHTFAAVMPLPEGMSEVSFAGVLAKRRFRYSIKEGFIISNDADFVICGEIFPNDVKPEGPFGDHLGYYSVIHDFPVLKVSKVYAKKEAIWPFTVVGRPPQEDSFFGKLIHDITDKAIEKEIPGLKAVNAVDEAGVHPLLLAIGSERYTPYNPTKKPQELLTIANHILGTGQMSLAKYLFICDQDQAPNIEDKKSYFTHIFRKVNWNRDLHFYTKTTIDTLDYSGEALNEGSKVVIAVAGDDKRNLVEKLPEFDLPKGFNKKYLLTPGNMIVHGNGNINDLILCLEKENIIELAMVTLIDDIFPNTISFEDWLWITFTRSNPSHDIYGLNSKIINKHFSCSTPVIDARIKPHHTKILTR